MQHDNLTAHCRTGGGLLINVFYLHGQQVISPGQNKSHVVPYLSMLTIWAGLRLSRNPEAPINDEGYPGFCLPIIDRVW